MVKDQPIHSKRRWYHVHIASCTELDTLQCDALWLLYFVWSCILDGGYRLVSWQTCSTLDDGCLWSSGHIHQHPLAGVSHLPKLACINGPHSQVPDRHSSLPVHFYISHFSPCSVSTGMNFSSTVHHMPLAHLIATPLVASLQAWLTSSHTILSQT